MSGNIPQKYILRSELLEVFKTVGAKDESYTLHEVWEFFKNYLKKHYKKLFRGGSLETVYCENDPLGDVFGVDVFVKKDAVDILKKNLTEIPPTSVSSSQYAVQLSTVIQQSAVSTGTFLSSQDPTSVACSSSHISIITRSPSTSTSLHRHGEKRTCEHSDDDTGVKRSAVPVVEVLYIPIPESPKVTDGEESVYSIQAYETEYVCDTPDVWTSDDDNENVNLINTEEYEVASIASSEVWEEQLSVSSSGGEEDIVTVDVLICGTDIEGGNLADTEDDPSDSETTTDPELSEGDKWRCLSCNILNRPLFRYCEKCWEKRKEWLPERPKKRRRKKGHKSSSKLSQPSDTVDGKNSSQEVAYSQSSAYSSASSSQAFGVGLSQDMAASHVGLSQDITASCVGLSHDTASSQESNICSQEENLNKLSQSPFGSDELEVCVDMLRTSWHKHPNDTGICSICHIGAKNATIVHGKTGHQTACYSCSKRMWVNGGRCPVCRKKIQKVIRNFIV